MVEYLIVLEIVMWAVVFVFHFLNYQLALVVLIFMLMVKMVEEELRQPKIVIM